MWVEERRGEEEVHEQMLVPDGLLFGVHMFITQFLGYLLFCIRYAKCCASDRILLFFLASGTL